MNKSILYLTIACCCHIFGLSSCATPVTSLYSWDKYDTAVYTYYKKQTPKSLEKVTQMYEKITTDPKGTRQVPPPGACAEYGYLLCLQGNKAQGMPLLEKEMELYPESKKFVERIISSINKEEE